MRYLIDTHVFLWFVSNTKDLTGTAKSILENEDNEIFLSIASLWEISIKTALGKLAIKGNYESVIDDVVENAIVILPINIAHTAAQNRLPLHHRDPFDRMLASQAIVEDMSFISSDAVYDQYFNPTAIRRIW